MRPIVAPWRAMSTVEVLFILALICDESYGFSIEGIIVVFAKKVT